MRVTSHRFDGWFLKGFSGLHGLLVDRSSTVKCPSPKLVEATRNLLAAIKECEANTGVPDEDTPDDVIAETINHLVEVLRERNKYGRLINPQLNDLLGLYHPINTVLTRFEDAVST